MATSACTGYYYTGYCPGAANIKCCIKKGTSAPAPVSTSGMGLDLWAYTSVSTFQCMANAGNSYVIVRGYRSIGSPDSNACPNLRNAVAAGFNPSKLDVYMFPCPTCSATPAEQMTQLMTTMRQCSSSWSGRVWLDIEGSQYWSSNDYNTAWFTRLVDACIAQADSCGIYTNHNEWTSIFGTTGRVGRSAALPLWYPRYPDDKSPTLTDFTPFGGWTTPYAKQYAGNTLVCGVSVDLDYAPAW